MYAKRIIAGLTMLTSMVHPCEPSRTATIPNTIVTELLEELSRQRAFCLNLVGVSGHFDLHDEKIAVVRSAAPLDSVSDISRVSWQCKYSMIDLTESDTLEKSIESLSPLMFQVLIVNEGQFENVTQALKRVLNYVLLVIEADTIRVYKSAVEASFDLFTLWTKRKGLLTSIKSLFSPLNMKNLKGQTLIASSIDYKPFSEYHTLSDGTIEWNGNEVDLAKNLAASMNAKLELKLPESGFWGRDKDGDGIYNGLIGELQTKRADIGFAQFFIKYDRLPIMDFSQPYEFDYNCFLTMRPGELPKLLALVRPFSQEVWLALLIMIVFVYFYLVLFILSRQIFRRGVNDHKELSFNAVLLFICSGIFSHSLAKIAQIRSQTLKFFTGIFLLVCFILARGYAGALISFLTIPLVAPPLNTMEDIGLSKIPTGSLRGSSYILEHSKNEHVVNNMRATHVAFRDFDLAFKNFSQGNLVLYQSRKFLEYNIRTRLANKIGETRAHIAQECPQYYYVALGLGRDSFYKEAIDERIQTFKESGLIEKWSSDALARAGKISESTQASEIRALLLEDLEGAFYVPIALYCLSGVVLMAEIMIYCLCRKKNSYA